MSLYSCNSTKRISSHFRVSTLNGKQITDIRGWEEIYATQGIYYIFSFFACVIDVIDIVLMCIQIAKFL